jgi:hypothetical protein
MAHIDFEQQVGITESGDISFDLDAFKNLRKANIIITKRLTEELINKLVEHKDKCILHLGCTGMGGTPIEPLTPSLVKTREMFDSLINAGFPVEQVVLRIDPVVPTNKGTETALKVIKMFKNSGITRVRYSCLDMYKHVKERFVQHNIKPPYETFHASLHKRIAVHDILDAACFMLDMDLEACGEPDITSISCISQKDIDILGLTNEIKLDGNADQRTNCHCPANKVEILTKHKPSRCKNKCLYCFWRDEN